MSQPELHDFISSKPKTEKCHGRIETRQYFLSTEIGDFIDNDEWKGIKAIGMVRSKRIINGEESTENRYFITSLTDLSRFSDSVRAHWGIENSLHWVLDIAFREDESRIRSGNAAENVNVLRHIGMNLLKQEKSCKMGIASKRKKCGYDMDYLYKVLGGLSTGIE